jgi:hypothetical protein
MNKYKYSVLQIDGLEIDLSIINKWMKLQGEGEYEIQITKKNEDTETE